MADLWTPASVTTALWLDAADASTFTISTGIEEWRDKSGNGRHATQSISSIRPYLLTGASFLLNGNTVTNFGSNNTRLEMATTAADLARNVSALTGYYVARTSGGTTNRPVLHISTPWNATASLWQMRMRSADVRILSAQGNSSASLAANPSNYHIAEMSANFVGDPNTIKVKVNGDQYSQYTTKEATNTFTDSAMGADTPLNSTHDLDSLNVVIGWSSTLDGFQGRIAEIILVDYIPTTEESQIFEGYLAHKWGLTLSLPDDHPYKSTAPVGPTVVNAGSFPSNASVSGDTYIARLSLPTLGGSAQLSGDPYVARVDVGVFSGSVALYGDPSQLFVPVVADPFSASSALSGRAMLADPAVCALPMLTGSLSAKITGVSIQGELPSIEGNLYSGATLTADLPSLEGTLTVQVERKADIVATLPVFTGQMFTGARISATMPKLAGSTTALVERTGSVSATMPRLSGSLDGTTEAVGNIVATLPIFTGEMFGTREGAGSITATLPRMSGVLDARTDQTFGITGTLPAMSGRLTAGRAINHDLTATMPRLSGFLTTSVPQSWAVLRYTPGAFR